MKKNYKRDVDEIPISKNNAGVVLHRKKYLFLSRRLTYSAWAPGRWFVLTLFLLVGSILSGCKTSEFVAGSVVGTAVIGPVTPTQEIQQIYYLGVFDPKEQLPSALYRVSVHGQAGALSNMSFGSGWVPAEFVDSLNTKLSLDQEDASKQSPCGKNCADKIEFIGRRLMLFGPEGFREAPRDHRLVIMMGQNPSGFFQAVDQALGVYAGAKEEQMQMLPEAYFEALRQIEKDASLLREMEIRASAQLR